MSQRVTTLAVTGATGTMGRAVIAAAGERDDAEVAFGVDPDSGDGEIGGVPVYPPDELAARLDEHGPDVLVDFSVPAATVASVRAAADAGVAAVVGTTGLDDGELEALREASESAPVLKASNFARGVQGLLRAVEAAVGAMPGYDVEVLETHHNRKLDAPSGTAVTVLDRIDSVRGTADKVYGREGEQPREPGEIGVHARRAGTIRGEHEVLLAGNDEVLTITHRAESRGVFAAGALDAAVWLAGRSPGWYSFEDVLDP